MSPEEAIRRAQASERLLNDEMFKEAIQTLRDRAIDDFKAAPPENETMLRLARVRYDVTEQFVSDIVNIIRDGEYAQKTST